MSDSLGSPLSSHSKDHLKSLTPFSHPALSGLRGFCFEVPRVAWPLGTPFASPSLDSALACLDSLVQIAIVPNRASERTVGCHCGRMAGPNNVSKRQVRPPGLCLFLSPPITHGLKDAVHSFYDFDSTQPRNLILFSDADQTNTGSDSHSCNITSFHWISRAFASAISQIP